MATPTAHTDAQGQNDIERNTRQWKDLDLFFSKKVGSNDINTLTDITAVKRSVRNLILMNQQGDLIWSRAGTWSPCATRRRRVVIWRGR